MEFSSYGMSSAMDESPAPIAEETTTPLWQGNTRPPSPQELSRLSRHRRLPYVPCYLAAFVLAGYLGQEVLSDATVTLFNRAIPVSVLLLPYLMVMLAVSAGCFIAWWVAHRAREQYTQEALAVTPALCGVRTVTLYTDRMESTGPAGTVTVPLVGAILREYTTLLAVENGDAQVVLRADDLTPSQTVALMNELLPRVADQRGRERFVPRRREETPPPTDDGASLPAPLATVTFSVPAKTVAVRRIRTLCGVRLGIWLPLVAALVPLLTQTLVTEAENLLLYFAVILLIVIALSLLLALGGVLLATRMCPQPLTDTLRFYPQYLHLSADGEQRVLPSQAVTLHRTEGQLVLATADAQWTWRERDCVEPTALDALG